MQKSTLTRRQFLGAAGAAAAACTIVPRHVLAKSGENPPSEKLNIAGIGVGGQGGGDVRSVADGNNIVALCDVDFVKAAGMFKSFPKARSSFAISARCSTRWTSSIDAVVVGTPDHTHAVAAMAAIRRGKHVYCEKPLAHSVYEGRQLMKAAKEHNVVTQLGNQGHSFESIRMFCEWIWDGAIGNVHTIHCGCSAVNSGHRPLGQLKQQHKVPESLDWDLWLGPAQFRPYCPAYCHYSWRGWVPFGNGTVGDWVCHVVDPVFWALDLGAPHTIVSETPGYDPKTQGDAYPKGEKITFQFAAKGEAAGRLRCTGTAARCTFHAAADLEPTRKTVDTGAVVLGDKGSIMYGSHGAGGVRMIPETKMRAYKLPPKTHSPRPGPSTATGCERSARARRPAPISPTAARSPRSPCWA